VVNAVDVFNGYIMRADKKIFLETVITQLCRYTTEIELVFISQWLKKGVKVEAFGF
jgi:hypothetical protein